MEESIYRGYVLDTVDPTKSGKIQVLVPIISEEPLVNWASPKNGKLGLTSGVFFVPEKGSKVFIEFECGNRNYPVYTPGEWDDPSGYHLEKASEFFYDGSGNPIAKGIKTDGSLIKFVEKKGDESLSIEVDKSDSKTGKRVEKYSTNFFGKLKTTFTRFLNNKKVSEINLTNSEITLNIVENDTVKGNITVKKDKIMINLNNSTKIELSSSGVIVTASKVTLAGEVTLSGVQPAMPGFCSVPNCLFTGAPHTTNKVGM